MNGVKEIIRENKHNSFLDKRTQWDLLKKCIKEYAIETTRNSTRNCNNEVVKLEREIREREKEMIQNPNDVNIQSYAATKQELNKLYDGLAEGAQIRSRAKWTEQGERNTKYFINMEKKNATKKEMKEVIDEEGNEVTGTEAILNEQKKFYQRLYKTKEMEISVDEFLGDVPIPQLPDEVRQICSGFITEEECVSALKGMSGNKSPGSDGLTTECYRFFWNDIKALVIASLNEAYTKGELSVSQKRGMISLLFKKGAENNLNNWRPIT